MCGIAGVLDWTGQTECPAVEPMVEAIRHRGPDAQMTRKLGPVVFGHARLSIIDLNQRANQPMFDSTANLLIVYNGEIYNFKTIRRDLEAAGTVFQTTGDTEVILEAYKAWGLEAFSRFNGMFAMALWDNRRRELVLARDRFGKKPLYIYPTKDGLVFASELKGLMQHAVVPRDIDRGALRQYLALGYLLNSRPIMAGVKMLAPAHYMIVDANGCRATRYWDYSSYFRQKQPYRNEGEAIEALDSLLEDAVRIRMIADVPLGAFLSGGIDSSTLTALMTRLAKEQINTFSIGFVEKSFDESTAARNVAKFLAVSHNERVMKSPSGDDFVALAYFADQPFADTSFLPTSDLSAFARQNVTVCLSGDGGDEIFLGYETYAADRIAKIFGRLPRPVNDMFAHLSRMLPPSFEKVGMDEKLRRFFAGAGRGFRFGHYSWRVNFSDEDLTALLLPELSHTIKGDHPFKQFDAFHDEVADLHELDQAAYVDAKTWLVDDILVKADRASMRHALELRAPLLDHRIAEFAAGLPVHLKLRGLGKKHLLCREHARLFPRRLRPYKKRGFNAPIAHWITGPMKDMAYEAIHHAKFRDWFDIRVIDALWNDHIGRRRDNSQQLLCLLGLGLWLQTGISAPMNKTVSCS